MKTYLLFILIGNNLFIPHCLGRPTIFPVTHLFIFFNFFGGELPYYNIYKAIFYFYFTSPYTISTIFNLFVVSFATCLIIRLQISKGVKLRQLSNHFNSVSTGKAVIPISINASIKIKRVGEFFKISS